MARPDLSFIKTQGGLGRPLAGKDHYSGLIVYSDTVSPFPSSATTIQIASLKGLEDAGVSADDSDFKYLHYHVSEFFRANPKGILWVKIEPVPATPASRTFVEIDALQQFSGGVIRQVAVFDDVAAFDYTQLTTIQSVVDGLAAIKMPLSVVVGSDISGVSDSSTLPDLRSLNAPAVSVCIAESGSVRAQTLKTALGKSLTSVGNLLGIISLAKVSDNIAYPEKFQIDGGGELVDALLANGTNIKDIDPSNLDAIHDKGYILPRQFVDIAATYYTDSPTAVSITSDFAYIENNRTLDKAIRNVRTQVQKKLNSSIRIEADGTISPDIIGMFKIETGKPLQDMQNDDEISAYRVDIDPTQDVLATSKIEIAITIIPFGTAREIVYNIGFAKTLS